VPGGATASRLIRWQPPGEPGTGFTDNEFEVFKVIFDQTMEAMMGRWTRDFRAEQVVKSLGLDWEYSRVRDQEIDRKRSRINRARVEPINREVADEYASSMETDAFPAIVCCELPDNEKLEIAGGNHRDEAWFVIRKESDPIYAIRVKCDRMEFDILCKALNAVEGVRSSTEHRIQQAADEVETWGITATEAAARLKVSPNRVMKAVELNRWRSELASRGYKIHPSVSEGALLAIKQFARESPVLDLLVKVLAKKVFVKDVAELTRTIREMDSESERVTYLEDYLARLTPKKKGVARPNYNNITRGLTTIENVLKKCTNKTQLQVPSGEEKEFIERCEALLKNITKMMNGSQVLANGSRKTRQ